MSDLLSPAAAGALLGVGPDRIAQLVRDGVLQATRTPGGHIRIERTEVERVIAAKGASQDDLSGQAHDDDAQPDSESDGGPPRHKWEDVPPWKRRVREAQADVEVLGLDDQKDRLRDAREQRQEAKEQAERDREDQASEDQRLRQLKSHALAFHVGFGVPAEVRAEAARELERLVTSARYPKGLTSEHTYALLKADADKCLAQWRESKTKQAAAEREPQIRELTILTAVVHAMRQMPADWDTNERTAFQAECRREVSREYEPGMTQEDANAIAFDVLAEWSDEEDDESSSGDDDLVDDDETEDEDEDDEGEDGFDDDDEERGYDDDY